MRVTEGMRYQQIQHNLARLQSEHADASRQASTGIRLDRPSADPIGAAELARLQASAGTASSQQDAIRMVRGDAELAESTLAQATELMSRARELAMQGANDSLNADGRAALALEARSVKAEMLGLANTQGTKGYIFGGSQTGTPAFAANGTFQGNDLDHMVDIGNGTPTAVNASGARAFGSAGGRDVFQDLESLASALEANDRTGSAAALDTIEASQKQITNERARVGLVVNKLDTSDAVLEQLGLDLGKRQATLAAADPFEAYSRMTTLGQALERAVAVSAKILEASAINRF